MNRKCLGTTWVLALSAACGTGFDADTAATQGSLPQTFSETFEVTESLRFEARDTVDEMVTRPFHFGEAGPRTPAKLIRMPEALEGRYIVVFHDEASPRVAQLVGEISAQWPMSLHYVYQTAIPGFAATMAPAVMEELRSHPEVRYIEQDAPAHKVAIQSNATWGLDRIDSRSGRNGQYEYNFDGSGVHAYIIDTGIRQGHSEFSGRIGNGYDSVSNDTNPEDCDGHGTHVAGTVGGTVYGVAKDVTLHGVRVLNCSGSGTNAGVIAGVDWVAANAISPAVGNMSLGGGASTSIDNAVAGAVSSGVVMVVAAGNSNTNACTQSPARSSAAITVGSTTNSDQRSSFSNFGSCVDIFAPGSSITSAWFTSNSATNTISGTSMASPHVAGIAALYLDQNPSASVSATVNAIINNATTGAVGNRGSGSPNLLAYSLFGGGSNPPPPPPPPPPSAPCSGPACEDYSGSLSGTGDWDAQPNGTYFRASAGTHRGWLEGPSGADFDLELRRWNGRGWSRVARSTSASSSESIVYSGSSGFYYWRILSYSGSGSYDFWMIRP